CGVRFTLSGEAMRPSVAPAGGHGTTPAGTRKLSSLTPPPSAEPASPPRATPARSAARTTPQTQVLTSPTPAPAAPAKAVVPGSPGLQSRAGGQAEQRRVAPAPLGRRHAALGRRPAPPGRDLAPLGRLPPAEPDPAPARSRCEAGSDPRPGVEGQSPASID